MPQEVEAYQHALTRLQDAAACCRRAPEDPLYRDGLIQRFAFTFELAWKSLKEYMEDQGADLSGIAFSRQVFRAAYAAGLIHDQQVWLDMLASRNVTSHVYDDAQAAQVAADICGRYIAPPHRSGGPLPQRIAHGHRFRRWPQLVEKAFPPGAKILPLYRPFPAPLFQPFTG